MKLRHPKNSLLFIILLMAICSRASAHVYPDHADPKVGSEIGASPKEVKIWFTGGIEPSFSSMEVLDANGKQVDKKDAKVDANDNTLLVVSVQQLPPGTYKVVWHVVATDTHKTKGDFKFVVK